MNDTQHVAKRFRIRPGHEHDEVDELALLANGRVIGRSSALGRGRWGPVTFVDPDNDPVAAFERYAERWGYTEEVVR